MDRVHQTFRFNYRGMNLRLVADAMPVGKFPMAVNIRADGDSKIRTRPGYEFAFSTGGKRITDMRAFSTLDTDNQARVIVHDSSGGVWLDDGVQKGTVGFGGSGASLIPYRPAESPEAWMYVGNATGYRKFRAPDASNGVVNYKAGIAEPQVNPEVAVDGLQYTEFTAIPNNYTPGAAAVAWTQGGDAAAPLYTAAPRSASGVGDTVVAIFKDPASVSPAAKLRYSVQLASVATYSIGETLIFATSAPGYINAEVEDVLPAINGGIALSVDKIWYLDGPIGHCVLVPTPPQLTTEPNLLPAVRRGSLIKIGTEVCMVWNVTIANNASVAIETSTVFPHSNGEALVGIPAIVVAGINSTVVGQTVGGAYITSLLTHATGDATLTQTLGTNPFTATLGSAASVSPNDYIHISLAADAPANITSFDLEFDVADGSFTQNVLAYNIPASLINDGFSGFGQFSEISFPISALVRTIGNDINQTLAQASKVRLHVKLSANVGLRFGSLWVGGGGELDIGEDGAPYLYRIRPRSLLTGTVGNPSPETRYAVSPRRQQVIINLPSASYDPQIEVWDIFRYGGTVPSWRRVGGGLATATTFIDNVSDAGALAGQLLEFDNFEPWPTVDVPWIARLGVNGITAMSVIGTVIVVLGSASAFPVSIMRWLPGTLLGLNGDPFFTLWSRPIPIAGGVMFRVVENGGTLTLTSVDVTEPNVAAQPLPYLWGPDANGVIFGCGDPFRPGVFYSAKQFLPDQTSNNPYDLVSPSEPLMGGTVMNGVSIVASSERWWQLQPAFNLPRRWIPVELPTGRGLAAPYGHCTDGKMIYFWGRDGIYGFYPGIPAISFTDPDLANLFPHDGVDGQDVTYKGHTIYHPDYSRIACFRLSIINNILRAHYESTDGCARCLVLDIAPDGEAKARMAWSVDAYANEMTTSYQIEQPPGSLEDCGPVCHPEPPLIFCALPNAIQDAAYSFTVTAMRGTGPYIWSITAGALPTGVTLAGSTGVISGTPTVVGTFNFTLQAVDSLGNTATKDCHLTVDVFAGLDAPLPLEIVDYGLSSDTSAITFRRSQFRFVKSDYPAGTTFRIDIVAQNFNVADKVVQILDSANAVQGSLTIPAGTTDTTLFENIATWAPAADNDVYRVKLPATTGVADVVIDALRIVPIIVHGAIVAVEIPMTAADGHTSLDQTSGGGDLFRTTSTVYTSLATVGWRWKYVAADWATLSSLRFSSVFTSAVTGATYGEVCLWDIDAAAAVAGVSVNNTGDPDTSPTYKDVDFDKSLLVDGHTYEPRCRRVGATTANVYMHKVRLAPHLTSWTKAVVPYRCGKGTSSVAARMKMPSNGQFVAGSVVSRYVEAFGTTDPAQLNKGSYIADGGLFDADHTFTNVNSSFCGPYVDTLPAGFYNSPDITADLTPGNRYGVQITTFINSQSQMLLWFKLVKP